MSTKQKWDQKDSPFLNKFDELFPGDEWKNELPKLEKSRGSNFAIELCNKIVKSEENGKRALETEAPQRKIRVESTSGTIFLA